MGIMGSHKNDRRYPGAKGRRPDNKKFRQEEAKERQEAYSKLSNKEKLTLLDVRLGNGVGAKKQREKLSKSTPKKEVVASQEVAEVAAEPKQERRSGRHKK